MHTITLSEHSEFYIVFYRNANRYSNFCKILKFCNTVISWIVLINLKHLVIILAHATDK